MSEDEGRTPLDPPHLGGARGPAPWERSWAVSPAPTPETPAPTPETPEPPTGGHTAEQPVSGVETPRRGLDATDDEQVSVAELLRRIGHRTGSRRRRHAEATATGTTATTDEGAAAALTRRPDDPAGPLRDRPSARPADARQNDARPDVDDDTVVLPAVVDAEHAPLGGTSSPPMIRTARQPPRVAQLPRPVAERAGADGADGADGVVPTRLQAKKSRRQRRAALGGKVALALAAILVFAVTGTAWSALRYVDAKQQTVQALDKGSAAIVEPEKQLGDENFLLIGSDSRAGASGAVGAGTESQVAGARSDTTILAHVPADRSRVVLVSFPRDLQVDLPACNRWDNDAASYTSEVLPAQSGVKLNTAYFDGGPRCITKVVQQLSGLSVNHFLGVDFAGFQSMVDAVGGVQVCTEKPLKDTVLGTVLAQAGPQTIDGKQSLNYVRARHVLGDPTSDYGRIQRQQRFLSSLLRASLSSNTLLNVGKLNSLVNAVTASTFGENVGVQQLLEIAQSMPTLDAGRVTFITAPTTGEANSVGNEVLLNGANAALFDAIRAGRPLPGEAAAATPSTPTTAELPPALRALAPSEVTFVVRNATATKGLASQVAAKLTDYGFRANSTDNYTSSVAGTVVRYSAGAEAAAQTLASSLPGATLEATTGLGTTVELVLGTSVLGATTTPTAAGSPLPAIGAAAAPTTSALLPNQLAVVNGGDATCT